MPLNCLPRAPCYINSKYDEHNLFIRLMKICYVKNPNHEKIIIQSFFLVQLQVKKKNTVEFCLLNW